jgi:hypothetical protein
MGIFAEILQKLFRCKTEILMVDVTYLKVHRTAASLRKGGASPRHIGRTKGGLGGKLCHLQLPWETSAIVADSWKCQ